MAVFRLRLENRDDTVSVDRLRPFYEDEGNSGNDLYLDWISGVRSVSGGYVFAMLNVRLQKHATTQPC